MICYMKFVTVPPQRFTIVRIHTETESFWGRSVTGARIARLKPMGSTLPLLLLPECYCTRTFHRPEAPPIGSLPLTCFC